MTESAFESPPPPARRKQKSVGRMIFDFLSSLGLATVLLLLLGILTWLATLEQIDNGLWPTLHKYFHVKSWYVLPEVSALPKINGNPITFPLPGGYWVCALLLLNLTLGGIIRIRKGVKQIGVLIAHFGIIFMIGSGGVTQLYSEEGNMAVGQGEQSNTAQDYREYVVEVAEVKGEKAEEIHVIRGKDLTDLQSSARLFRIPELPFDVEISGYFPNAAPVSVDQRAPDNHQLVCDGYYLAPQPDHIAGKPVEEEAKTAACYGRIVHRDGKKDEPFILAGASFYPLTVRVDDRIFTLDMHKRLWPMPFMVTLDHFEADFHPGTQQASKYVSHITRTEDGHDAKVTIQMNEPMRYKGFTFYQASYGPQGAGPKDKLFSVFAVVSNPADQWPKYSLIVVGCGLFIHFIMKLISFLTGANRQKRDA